MVNSILEKSISNSWRLQYQHKTESHFWVKFFQFNDKLVLYRQNKSALINTNEWNFLQLYAGKDEEDNIWGILFASTSASRTTENADGMAEKRGCQLSKIVNRHSILCIYIFYLADKHCKEFIHGIDYDTVPISSMYLSPGLINKHRTCMKNP